MQPKLEEAFREAEAACGEALAQNVIRIDQARRVGRPMRSDRDAPGVMVSVRINPQLATALAAMRVDKVVVVETAIRTLQLLAAGDDEAFVELWRPFATAATLQPIDSDPAPVVY